MGTRRTENELRENPAVKAEWSIGQRTPAWTKLWLRIFADVLPNNEDVTNDAGHGPLANGPTPGWEEESRDAR